MLEVFFHVLDSLTLEKAPCLMILAIPAAALQFHFFSREF
jgi:hypothetical protein